MPDSSVDYYANLLDFGKTQTLEHNVQVLEATTDPGLKTDDPPRNYNGCFSEITEIRGDDDDCEDVFITGSSSKYEAANKEKFADYSLLLRHIEYSDTSRIPRAQMEINSDTLCERVRDILSRFTYLALNCRPMVITAPYCELYHCYEDILEAHRVASGALAKELNLLLKFYERYVSPAVRNVKSMIKSGEITFANLWALFPPGQIVVLQNNLVSTRDIYTCMVVKRYEIIDGDQTPYGRLTATYRSLECSAEQRVIEKHDLDFFTGVRRITSLEAFPLKYHPQSSSLRKYFVGRGQAYSQLYTESLTVGGGKVGSHLQHMGPIWMQNEQNRWDDCPYLTSPSEHIRGRFIVDPKGMVEELPAFEDEFDIDNVSNQQYATESSAASIVSSTPSHSECPTALYPSHLPAISNDVSRVGFFAGFTEEDFLTFPARVKGYSLSRKKWGYVLVDDLKQIKWEDNSFDKLQIDPDHRHLIKTLVSSHQSHSTTFDDVIPEKGRGLVFLLCGSPGTGKTMTAESAAESLHCPLYTVTSHQLGSEVSDIENELRKVLKLIVRWNAVLLIDEADVYVAKRTDANSQGNELVSVFLRLLEYQSGVVFLSTNRQDNIDIAFQSRVHVQIVYKTPGPEERVRIWRQLAEQCKHSLGPDDFRALAERELSGRDIKNALRVASLYAPKSEDVQRSHIELALKYIVGAHKIVQ